jgi:hypothetical protein
MESMVRMQELMGVPDAAAILNNTDLPFGAGDTLLIHALSAATIAIAAATT